MRLSIIICTYNSASYLETALLSIFTQKFKDYEVIIVDNVSVDGTLDIVKKYENKFSSKLRWISEKDAGIYDAMNKGIDLAQGEWLYFLGSDDILFNNKILESVSIMIDSNKWDVICGNIKLKHSGKVHNIKISLVQILERGIHHQAIFCKKDLFEKFGNFDISYKGVADWEFNMRWFNDPTVKIACTEDIIALYNEKGFSNSFQDGKFIANKRNIIKRNFSPLIYFLYKNKLFVFVDIIEKSLALLKREGIISFMKNMYNFILHGRDYFKKEDE